jgi:hypothetical protein
VTEGSVCLAYVHPNEVAHSWHQSVLNLMAWDIGHDQRVMRGGFLAMRCGTDGLAAARNRIAEQFLAGDAEWLFVVDTDMGFAPDTIDRLIAAADPVERPIIGALAFAQREVDVDGFGGYRCQPRVTILDYIEGPNGGQFAGRTTWRANALTQCAATGMACIVIHRSVIQAIHDRNGTWFDRIAAADGGLLGEDVSFCVRAGAAGFPVYVHTGIRTTHLKQLWLSEQDFLSAIPVTPATEDTAVIVPVMKRPQNAEAFMQSLHASTGLVIAYVVADADDTETIHAWLDAGATVWTEDFGGRPGSFAEKVNFGYRMLNETWPKWVFIVGDDVRFHPGWLDHAQHVAKTQGAAVVGTNDLANPRVMSGEHGTHLLISREYIEERGASWDGPGVVCHEGYRHWFVDDEIVTVAKSRGEWASALGSIVEHLHPIVGKAPMDAVYERGNHNAERDKKTFQQRCAEHFTTREAARAS